MAVTSTSWKKGQSGNPSGRPKENAEVKRLALEESVPSMKKLIQLRDTSTDQKIVLAACQTILDRALGKPPQAIVGDEDHAPVLVKGVIELVKPEDGASE